MCVDLANCGGHCPECQAQTIERLRAKLRAYEERLQIHIDTIDGIPTGLGEDEIDRLRAKLAKCELERDALVAMLADLFDWNDRSYTHAVMHVENCVNNLRADARSWELQAFNRVDDCVKFIRHAERLEAVIRNDALPVIRDACQVYAIYGDQPPALYLESIDKLSAVLEDK